ncbi:hypothetical protein CJU90_3304 [Yarrowia sp. C11]|nr:hypothetical protein CJU90_3304 [Yarrowia sp. C11]
MKTRIMTLDDVINADDDYLDDYTYGSKAALETIISHYSDKNVTTSVYDNPRAPLAVEPEFDIVYTQNSDVQQGYGNTPSELPNINSLY